MKVNNANSKTITTKKEVTRSIKIKETEITSTTVSNREDIYIMEDLDRQIRAQKLHINTLRHRLDIAMSNLQKLQIEKSKFSVTTHDIEQKREQKEYFNYINQELVGMNPLTGVEYTLEEKASFKETLKIAAGNGWASML